MANPRGIVAVRAEGAAGMTREQVAQMFGVPIELISDPPTFEPLLGDARWARLPVSVYQQLERIAWGEDA